MGSEVVQLSRRGFGQTMRRDAWWIQPLVIFIVPDVLLTRAGFYRLFWHPALVRTSLFVCWFCAGGLASLTM